MDNEITDIEFLEYVFLTSDSGEGVSKIVGARGAECGLDHIEISTQDEQQYENGIKMVYRIYAEEQDV